MVIEMDKIKIGDRIKIIGNLQIHHHLAIPSTAEVIGVDGYDLKVFGHDKDGKIYEQWVSVIDVLPIRKAVIK